MAKQNKPTTPKDAEKPQKHPGGRPTKYRPEMCDVVIKCGQQGGAVAEMADSCDVCVETLYEWSRNHKEFLDSFTRAQTAAEAFHARRVRGGLDKTPAEFQGAANLKYMAQRFQARWSEKSMVELSGKGGGPIAINITPDDQAL